MRVEFGFGHRGQETFVTSNMSIVFRHSCARFSPLRLSSTWEHRRVQTTMRPFTTHRFVKLGWMRRKLLIVARIRIVVWRFI